LKCAKFAADTFSKADCVVLVTDHTKIDYDLVVKHSKLIIDTRNKLKDVKDRKKIVKL